MKVTDEHIQSTGKKLEGRWGHINDAEMEWFLGTFSIHKRLPQYRVGYSFDLAPESRLFRRWFDLPDAEIRGWAIIFRGRTADDEILIGWVPPEREAVADRWISFLNAEIQHRLKGVVAPVTSGSDRVVGLGEDDDAIFIRNWMSSRFSLAKHSAAFRRPFEKEWSQLHPDSRLYKRWFEYPDVGESGLRGWEILFRVGEPGAEPAKDEEFVGWVNSDRGHDADMWIESLNAKIRERLARG